MYKLVGNKLQARLKYTDEEAFTFTDCQMFILGSDVTLECVGYGEPTPQWNWRRKNGPLPKGRFFVTTAGLKLINVTASDGGVYICEIDNGVSPKLEHHFDVVLQGK